VSLATTVSFTDKGSGEEKTCTEWHPLLFLGAQATECRALIDKGSKLFIEGKLVTGDEVVNGKKRWVTEIRVETYSVLSGQPPQMSRASALAQLKASMAKAMAQETSNAMQTIREKPVAVLG